MIAKQHIPNYVEGFMPQVGEFNTVEELLNIPFVKKWNDDQLQRFSLDKTYSKDTMLLMAEMKDASYWVVAYLDQAYLDLPKFEYAC